MFTVFDIEAKNWKEFLIMGSYDGEHYQEHESISDFMEYIFSTNHTNSTVYAHFGGIFDFLYIIDFLFSQNTPTFEITNIILQGRKMLKFDITKNKRRISFVDSSGLFPFGLAKLTESFNVKHKKLDEDVSHLTKVTKKLRKYLEHDNKGLWECLEKFANSQYINQVGLKLTRSGTSFAVYKNFFNADLPVIPSAVKDFARLSYYGGRTEIFKPLYKGFKKPLNVYDINSMYPDSMFRNKYPAEFSHWTTELDLKEFSIYHCVVTCPKNLKIPLLATKSTGKLIFPTGTFEGHFTNVELVKALSLGYKVNKVFKGAVFNDGGYMFKDFIDHFYTLRKNTNDPVEKIIYKDIMNHLYGRLAINETREQVTFEQPKEGGKIHSIMDFGDYEIRLYTSEKKIFTYSNPALSSFVTSYARLKLFEYMEAVNFDVYYCDTDSLFTPRKMKDSNELGGMKLEYQLKEACFLLPKTYSGRKLDGDIIRKMKGFPSKKLGHIQFEDFVESISGEIRLAPVEIQGGLAGFKTAMKKGEILHVLPDSTKQLRSKYDKRTITFKNNKYDSVPLELTYPPTTLGENNGIMGK